MNFNNFTIKSQEAIQQAQQIAQGFGNQQIENEHILKAIFEVDENVLPFILKKLNVNLVTLKQILDKQLESFPKVSGNVWEWCLDEYLEEGYVRFKGKAQTNTSAIAWPTQAFPRTLRGGSWDDDATGCRAASRLASHDTDWKAQDPNLPLSPWWFTDDPARAVGFRVLRPLNELPKAEMAKYWDPDDEDIKFDVQIRLEEGRGILGIVDETLPAAIQSLEASK